MDEPCAPDAEHQHPIFTLDPQSLIDRLDKQVIVSYRNGPNRSLTVEGLLYSIDPITQNLIIISGLQPVADSQTDVAATGLTDTGDIITPSDEVTTPRSDEVTTSRDGILSVRSSEGEEEMTLQPSGRGEAAVGDVKINLITHTSVLDLRMVGPALPDHVTLAARLFNPPEEELSDEMLERRKQDVKALLTAHRIPVEETSDASLRLGQHFTISAPYTAKSCSSTNELILAKVQALINGMAVK